MADTYVNARTRLTWECAKGHQWNAVPNSIKSGSWCPDCARRLRGDALRLDIEAMRQMAKTRGGTCQSKTYLNSRTKLSWKCGEGHQWEANPSNISSGKWCPYCSGNIRLTIEKMQQLAAERGGKCISGAYVDNRTKLLWECSEGHHWKANAELIRRGLWCPKCRRLKKNGSAR